MARLDFAEALAPGPSLNIRSMDFKEFDRGMVVQGAQRYFVWEGRYTSPERICVASYVYYLMVVIPDWKDLAEQAPTEAAGLRLEGFLRGSVTSYAWLHSPAATMRRVDDHLEVEAAVAIVPRHSKLRFREGERSWMKISEQEAKRIGFWPKQETSGRLHLNISITYQYGDPVSRGEGILRSYGLSLLNGHLTRVESTQNR